MKLHFSSKHIQIDKAKNMMFIVITAAAVITVFSLVTAKTLLSQAAFQRRVLNAKHATVKTLITNLESAKKLEQQYQVFATTGTNVIGGSRTGAGPQDGDNPRIVLDALPSTYDFPALTSSIEKILKNDRITVQGISGIDNEASSTKDSTGKPEPIIMNFAVDGSSDYGGVQTLIKDFERSIRPFDVVSLTLNGSESSMHFSASVNTYYQQAKTFTLTSKDVK